MPARFRISPSSFSTSLLRTGRRYRSISPAVLLQHTSTLTHPYHQPISLFTTTFSKMGVEKTTTQDGTGAQPVRGQTVTIEYTGYLKDPSKPGQKGKQFDSSVGRADLVTKIGVGHVIKGWDEGVTQMKVGEKATLDISSDYGYGEQGFTGHIPPNADLIFDVYLKGVK